MSVSTQSDFSLLEVTSHLQLPPDILRQWSNRFAALLSSAASSDAPRYTIADVTTLLSIQKLVDEGLTDEQVGARLTPKRLVIPAEENFALTPQQGRQLAGNGENLSNAVGDLLSTIASSQQTVLNSQNTVREMVNVVVQDNFNLKEENRKLRERMVEMERDLTEYQRKEETRRERVENRMRALEGTVSALQQQVAQLIQLQRQAQSQNMPRRRGWW